jgi:hypothetical protein
MAASTRGKDAPMLEVKEEGAPGSKQHVTTARWR